MAVSWVNDRSTIVSRNITETNLLFQSMLKANPITPGSLDYTSHNSLRFVLSVGMHSDSITGLMA